MGTRKKTGKDYRHPEAGAVLRPEGGAQGSFPKGKRFPPRTYKYDSSLSPELDWDESGARKKGERLISEILSANDLGKAQEAAMELKKIQRHFLNWAGKAERSEIRVPSLPLFVHERLSTNAILKTLERHKRDRQTALDLFGEGKKSIDDAIAGSYEHMNGWQNRLIFGDSLQIMNSLLSYEHMGGKVQMIYMDPPYGVRFGSNFKPFVRKGGGGEFRRRRKYHARTRNGAGVSRHMGSWHSFMADLHTRPPLSGARNADTNRINIFSDF